MSDCLYTVSLTPTRVPNFVPCTPCDSSCKGLPFDISFGPGNDRVEVEWSKLDLAAGTYTANVGGIDYYPFVFTGGNGVTEAIVFQGNANLTVPKCTKFVACEGFPAELTFTPTTLTIEYKWAGIEGGSLSAGTPITFEQNYQGSPIVVNLTESAPGLMDRVALTTPATITENLVIAKCTKFAIN